ncbi:MAG: phosphatidylglycerophosphatase A [Polyangiaceae bacterium]
MTARVTFANVVATWFGCGLSPVAPGTVGSLGTLPLFFLLRGAAAPIYWGVVLLVTVLGIWSSQVVAETRGDKDPQRVVIDEVAGVLIALGWVRERQLVWLLLALALFRLLDIYKPGLIRPAERLPPIGLGIMADDLLAGLVAGLISFTLASVL